MSFFERNRQQLIDRGIDPARLPPGQYYTDRYPVLHVGDVPDISRDDFRLRVFGEVERPTTFTFADIEALGAIQETVDIHCVTKWTKLDMQWKGVRFADVVNACGVLPTARFVLEHAAYGYTTNVPLADCMRDDVLIAWEHDGVPLEAEHGGPVRMVIPHLYFWKSAKWLEGIELRAADQPGFWEQNGYHMYGDPFREQRFSGDS
ncbi:MAG TPA: sulfite oxidase-like oxidoreductase [Acidimicrobiia bacterium]|jgi:DMSO/TMAO reductase YedYZ molybdopterin-dependent catalytic subunit